MIQKTSLFIFIIILLSSCCIPSRTLSWRDIEHKTVLLKSGKEIDRNGDKENINRLNLAYLDCVEQTYKACSSVTEDIYEKMQCKSTFVTFTEHLNTGNDDILFLSEDSIYRWIALPPNLDSIPNYSFYPSKFTRQEYIDSVKKCMKGKKYFWKEKTTKSGSYCSFKFF